MSNVHVMDHPLIQHKIGIIRREETGSKDFRMMIGEIAMLMCYEATRDLITGCRDPDTDLQDDSKRACRKEACCCSDPESRTWNGRRYACDDSGCKSRSYRFVP